MAYKCKKCKVVKNDRDIMDKWCEKCELLTEKTPLDLEAKMESYGKEHPVNCPNGCAEMVVTRNRSVDFQLDDDLFYADVVLIICPVCRYRHDLFAL